MLNSNQIQEIIPHRYPFLLVDQITELESGKKAKGIKCVSANEMHFAGHFPQEHVMPGVLIIEALAQVGAVVMLSKEENKGQILYFGGIKSAKFKRKVIPGDKLVMEVEIIQTRGTVGIGKGRAMVDDEIACEAELIFAKGK
ncbi:MAG: 3-hydroxyacyl-ACP dehydratase FabZ [Clostridia bacterium]|nr:3-hydroxyacyl-ACP dehydratase FabZ [Clostridia bacterium]MDD3231891.1 3-hydroxyacyl-ACP dehydratase FabZ [Clostridia bacterium]MDD3862331.1 3-hydroxyacyl-ACP dehydratase FabZ [Clostridia bacterium]